MKVSRRKFLAAAPAVIGTILVSNNSSFARSAPPSRYVDPLEGLSFGKVTPYIGTTFAFSNDSGAAFQFRLDRVDDRLTANQRRGQGECFSMIFSSSALCPLKQGTYRVNHPELGRFRLMVTVQYSMDGRKKYEAIINRISE